MTQHTAFIFARGGSKGIVDKNIQMAGGKPLIAHSIDCGIHSARIDRVVVSTDSEKIAEVARSHGAEVLMRPEELARDDTPEIMAWRHAIDSYADYFAAGGLFISLPATSPLRIPAYVDAAITRYERGDCDIVFSVTECQENPYLTVATATADGHIEPFIKDSTAYRRQDAPKLYNIIGCVYVTNPTYVQQAKRLVDGKVGYIEVKPQHAVDVDEPYDLYLADLLLSHPFKG